MLEVSGKRATVVFGMLKTTVDTARLRHTAADPDRAPARQASFVSTATADDLRDRQLSFKRDIDVRGMRVDEALQAITYFIDDAVQFSAGRVRILHGTLSTGALRQAIRRYLDTVAGVASYRDEHVQFGGRHHGGGSRLRRASSVCDCKEKAGGRQAARPSDQSRGDAGC